MTTTPRSDPPPLNEVDRLVHEPARLLILSQLFVIESCDFLFMQKQTGLTRGNLSSHMSKLEDAGYIEVIKQFEGKHPRTLLRLSEAGRRAFKKHVATINQLLSGITN